MLGVFRICRCSSGMVFPHNEAPFNSFGAAEMSEDSGVLS